MSRTWNSFDVSCNLGEDGCFNCKLKDLNRLVCEWCMWATPNYIGYIHSPYFHTKIEGENS